MSTIKVDTITDGAGTGAPNFPNGVTGVTQASTIIYVAQNTAPTGYLKANGAALSRTTYADLFTAIGTTFGSGDGSTTFNLPDLRGEFLRGWDDSRGIDSGRSFGSAQADDFTSHQHKTNARRESSGINDIPWGQQADGTSTYGRYTYGTSYQGDYALVSPTGGSETRPRNVALLACIKY